jgi:hypothetical protein
LSQRLGNGPRGTAPIRKKQSASARGWLTVGWTTPIRKAVSFLETSMTLRIGTPKTAADNFPFLLLTGFVTDSYHVKQATLALLEQERRLTSRVGSLPDDFSFRTQALTRETVQMDEIVFGASEYAKDGLMPIVEMLGDGPWMDRLVELMRDIWAKNPNGVRAALPERSHREVEGELLQVLSRLYWRTKDEQYRQRAFAIAEHYLLEQPLVNATSLQLDDHACEIVGGLSEAYVIARFTDPDRRERWRGAIHQLFDRILEKGRNEDGFFYNAVDLSTGKVLNQELTDNWGYSYNAIWTVGTLDEDAAYTGAVGRVLRTLERYVDYPWENRGADGYADAIEGGLNLLNRVPVQEGFQWVDQSMALLLAKQQPNGIVEEWYGDGNSARTALMYALWKTQGVSASPWREDLQIGAEVDEQGGLRLYVEAGHPWEGALRFDRARHKEWLSMPFDYPRINQFPEWFVVDDAGRYEIKDQVSGEVETVSGAVLREWRVSVVPATPLKLSVKRLDGE